MKREWLWDRKIGLRKVKKVLSNPKHRDFTSFAALLLMRKNEPQEVFKEYIDPIVFCKNWAEVKRLMRKDKWSSQRIIFWQAIYEKLLEKYRNEGINFRERKEVVLSELCKKVGSQIQHIRKEQGLSQKALAKKIGISQQLVSRIEKGKENVSLMTLATVMKALNRKISINFR